MGDFNFNLLDFESHTVTDEFINTLAAYCFQPHIIKPTRITDHSATLIDNIYFNSIEHQTISGNLLCDLTDLLPNFLIINRLASTSYKYPIYRRDYSNFNEEALLAEVQSINWDDVLPAEPDVNVLFESFHAKISEIINRHVPLKKLSKRESPLRAKPWITKGLRISIAIKNKLHKSYLKSKNSEYYISKFKYYRNKLKHLLLISKKSYYNTYFLTNKDSIKGMWKEIKESITLKHTKNNRPTTLEIGRLKVTDRQSIASAFNDYFACIGSNPANAIPLVNTSIDEYMCNPLCNSFALFPVTVSEVVDEINNLNSSKSVGHSVFLLNC